MYPEFDDFKWLKKFPGQTSFHIKQGIARTQSPTNKNYAAKFPTFGEIVGVNRPEVQWNSLVLGELPPWSQLAPQPGKYALARNAPQSTSLFPICPAQFCLLRTICCLPFCFAKLNDNMTSLWMKKKHLTKTKIIHHQDVRMVRIVFLLKLRLKFQIWSALAMNKILFCWSALRSGDTVTSDRIERCCYC